MDTVVRIRQRLSENSRLEKRPIKPSSITPSANEIRQEMAQATWILRQTVRQSSYWLILRDEYGRAETLTTRLSGGEKTLPVFSFREEAETFLCVRVLGDGWRITEVGAEELLSILHTALRNTQHVTLDPIAEAGPGILGLLSLDRKTFMEGLAKTLLEYRLAVLAGVMRYSFLRNTLALFHGDPPTLFHGDPPKIANNNPRSGEPATHTEFGEAPAKAKAIIAGGAFSDDLGKGGQMKLQYRCI